MAKVTYDSEILFPFTSIYFKGFFNPYIAEIFILLVRIPMDNAMDMMDLRLLEIVNTFSAGTDFKSESDVYGLTLHSDV